MQERYKIQDLPDSDIEVLAAIGVQRGCIRKGGGVELQKVSALLINELRAGLLGPISLETPEMTTAEEETAKIDEAQKAKAKEQQEKLRQQKARKRYR